MNYFENCECQETAKKLYHSLAKKLHPDVGGSKEEMAELTKQYEDFQKNGNLNSRYKDAMKSWDSMCGSGDPEVSPKGRGQTAGWTTNKPKTNNEGYGDIPWDHPIRQELFNLRNRLASCDNTYKRPRAPDYDERLQEVDIELRKLQRTHLDLAAKNLNLTEKNTELEFNLQERQKDLERAKDKIKSIESKLKDVQLKFRNMDFFAKICYLFFSD